MGQRKEIGWWSYVNKTYYVAGIPVSGDYLMHTRTVGSKNGVRRYQYEDGKLTPLGKIHYGIGKGGMRAQTDSGSSQVVNRPNQMSGSGPSTKMMTAQRAVDPSSDVSYTARDAYLNGRPGHSYREITEEEYNQLVNPKPQVVEQTTSILDNLANATPQVVQTSVAVGKKVAKKLTKKKKKPNRVITTNSARTLNERTKNLTDLSDQEYLRDYFKQGGK